MRDANVNLGGQLRLLRVARVASFGIQAQKPLLLDSPVWEPSDTL